MMRADAVACLRTDTRREQQGRRETTRGRGKKERKRRTANGRSGREKENDTVARMCVQRVGWWVEIEG